MDAILSSSSSLVRLPLPPVRVLSGTTRPYFAIGFTSSTNKLPFGSSCRRREPLSAPAVRKFTIRCGAIKEIRETEFRSTVLESDRPVLVEFVANWCGPCRLISPAIEWVAQEYGDRLMVVKIDHDANPALIEEYKVYGLPTLILFKNGQEVPESRREGAITKAKLKEYVDELLETISVA